MLKNGPHFNLNLTNPETVCFAYFNKNIAIFTL